MNGGKINIKGSRIKTNEHQIIIALREKVLEFCVEPHTVKVFIKALVEQGRLVPEDPAKKRNVRYMVPKK